MEEPFDLHRPRRRIRRTWHGARMEPVRRRTRSLSLFPRNQLVAMVLAGIFGGLSWAALPLVTGETGDVAFVGSEAPSTRASFTLCHSGGGTNCVVDGDTFRMGGAKIRIADIDTPETHPAHCAREAALGEAATRRLHALLNSGAVSLHAIDRDTDRYGRLLRRVSVNGRGVGDTLVAEGLARPYEGGRRAGWC